MPGAGKTEVARFLINRNFKFIRLGQLTLDEVKRRGLEPGEASEKPIREELRRKHGMAAFAILNFPKIDERLKKGNGVVDGLYSWEEYLAFKKKYGEQVIIIAVYASPKTRYARLEAQQYDKAKDINITRRHYHKEEAQSRDRSQLENIHTGGPIAMADYIVVNEDGIKELIKQVEKIRKKLDEN